MRRSLLLCSLCAIMVGWLAVSASANWTVTVLSPESSVDSDAWGVCGQQQVGGAWIYGGAHAVLWNDTAQSWVDLNPPGATGSGARATDGLYQVGGAEINNNGGHAGIWTGTAASWVDLHPAGAESSEALGVSGGQQVGTAIINSLARASLWYGTAASWVDLTPAGAYESDATGVCNGRQVGYTIGRGSFPYHAAMWTSTAESWVDLNPVGAVYSVGHGISDDQQVGEVSWGSGALHACLWTGTAASFVDLNPLEALFSSAIDVSGGIQVGSAVIGYHQHAGLWRGTAESWMDLHALLPQDYSGSEALGVDVSGDTVRVVGIGYRRTEMEPTDALLWTYVVPEPSSLAALAVALAGLCATRCRRRA